MVDRITSLWKRMGEMYGAKALETKFGLIPPDTWRIAIDRLKDFEIERGMRRMVYGGKPHIPSLPEFLRMCREVGGDDFVSADQRPIPRSHQLESSTMQRWEAEGGLHLLGYITRSINGKLFSTDPKVVEKLVEAKRYWAQDMRESEESGEIPADGGKAKWDEYIRGAEQSISHMSEAI